MKRLKVMQSDVLGVLVGLNPQTSEKHRRSKLPKPTQMKHLFQMSFRRKLRFRRGLDKAWIADEARNEMEPNKAMEPIPVAVTVRAGARPAPSTFMAHL